MARRKPDTVKSATSGFQALLNRGELPAGTKTAGDLARESSDPTRYGYQPPLPTRPRPTAPVRKGGGGAQPSRTRAPSPGLPRNPPLPPPRPSMPGLDKMANPDPYADWPDRITPKPMGPVAGGIPDWQLGDAGFGGPTEMAGPPQMPNPQLPIPAMANALPRPGISTPGTMPQPPAGGGPLGIPSPRSSAMAAPAPAGGSPLTAGPTMGSGPPPLSNMPTMGGATPPMPAGLLDPNMLRQLFGGR